MKVFIRFSLVLIILVSCSPANQNSFTGTSSFEVVNPLGQSRKDVAVFIPVDPVPVSFVVRSNESQLAAQNYGNGILVVLDSLKANEKRILTVYFGTSPSDVVYKKRTQATMIDAGLPAIESEHIAYAVSGGVEILGKSNPDMILMGIDRHGGSRKWVTPLMTSALNIVDHRSDSIDAEIIQSGDLFSQVRNTYFDTVKLVADISMIAGGRLLKHELDTNVVNTSMFQSSNATVYESKGSNYSWGYVATYGNQGTDNGNVGLVMLFSPSDSVTITGSVDRFAIQVETKSRTTEFYFGAAWSREPNGISNENAFMKWVERSARELANPVILNAR